MTNPDDHWRSLASDLWEVKTRKNTDNRLNNTELDYLRDLSESSYTDTNMQTNRIPNALDNLPGRFEDLSEDIALLKLKSETNEELWKEMLNINPRAGHLNNIATSNKNESENKEFKLGYELGSIIESMMAEYASEHDRMDVVRGFTRVFTGEPREGLDENKITTHGLANQLIEEHPPEVAMGQEEIENIFDSAGMEDVFDSAGMEDVFDSAGIEDRPGNAISETLKQQGITPSAYLLQILEDKAEQTEDQFSALDPESDIEHVVNISTVSTAEAKSVISQFLKIYPDLKHISQLHATLLEDTQRISEGDFHTAPFIEVVEELWKHKGEGLSYSTIDSEIDTKSSDAHTQGALRRLSNGGEKELRTNRPVTVGEKKWKLTGYGKVISFLLFEIRINNYNSSRENIMKESEDYLGLQVGLDFDLGLRELLHHTAISPATVGSEFVNAMKEMLRNSNSCANWRDRVSTMNSQDQ